MPITDFKLEYNSITENKTGVPVVIVAAGSSSRMGGIDKILAQICGIPVIARTMLAFERNKNVSEIVVVTKEESIADIEVEDEEDWHFSYNADDFIIRVKKD